MVLAGPEYFTPSTWLVGDGISLDTEQWKIGSSAKCAWLLDDTWSVGGLVQGARMIRRAAIATRGRPTPACSGIAIRPTIVHGNTDGNNLVIDVHVQELAETPLLAEGDLLVFRGDVVQKPQDIHAECIDVSFRMIDPDQLLVRSRLAVGGFTKYESMINNRVTYHAPLDAFDVAGRPELTAGELAPIYDRMLRDALDRPIVSIPRFLPALTRGCIA